VNRVLLTALATLGGLWLAGPATAGQGATAVASDVIAEVRLHGNQITSDDELLRLAGIQVGEPFTATTIQDVTDRLQRTGRFRDIQVLKRFASIADPSRIALVVIVDEGPVSIEIPEGGGAARVVRRGALKNLMVSPVLLIEDGYGVTFGARLAYARGSPTPASWDAVDACRFR
jgi:outer membrane protein assembly factor BamA